MPEASHAGQLPIGDVILDAYVLEDGRRLLHKRGMARGLGLKSDRRQRLHEDDFAGSYRIQN